VSQGEGPETKIRRSVRDTPEEVLDGVNALLHPDFAHLALKRKAETDGHVKHSETETERERLRETERRNWRSNRLDESDEHLH
jgi:hypothetical protein